MSYNRWLIPDELEHHQRKGAHWGVYNGPPYPLERQKRFSPDGGKVSQKKYLQVTGSGRYTKGSAKTRSQTQREMGDVSNRITDMSILGADAETVRALLKKKRYITSEKTAYQRNKKAEREERKANPEGTAWEQMERDNPINKLKGAYRRYKNDQKRIAEENRKFDEDNKLFDEATDRVNKIEDLTEGEQRELAAILAKQQHDSKRKGSTNAKELADEVNAFADRVEKEHITNVKQHGTAEEVMKYRDTFTKEEWREIADRLEAEARVKRLLDKPVTTQNNQGGQQNQGKQNQPSQNVEPVKENLQFANRKTREIYEKGTAREIYDNRDKFTPEQLEKVTKRLEAEEKIGKYADVQVKIKSNKELAFEKARDYLKIAGDTAEGIGKIMKLLETLDDNNNSGNGGSGKITEAANIIKGVANAGEGGGKKKKGRRKKKNNG